MRDLFPGFGLDAVRQLHAEQVCRLLAGRIQRPEELLVADREPVDCVESSENVFARTQAECTQENGSEELPLTVDSHIQNILLVVLERNPRTTVGNDLAEEVSAVIGGFEEYAW